MQNAHIMVYSFMNFNNAPNVLHYQIWVFVQLVFKIKDQGKYKLFPTIKSIYKDMSWFPPSLHIAV